MRSAACSFPAAAPSSANSATSSSPSAAGLGSKPRLRCFVELDGLLAAGKRTAFFVDDNLIGNKKAIKPLLRDVIAWQQAKGYPLMFATEASIDLAEDPELMQLMVDANICEVFIGIETPNEAALRETKKIQNLRARGGTLLDKVHCIQEAGMEVWCGMIVGFDNDDASIFMAQRRFVKEARIVNAMVNILVAIPRTPLYKRLHSEGRLDNSGDASVLAHSARTSFRAASIAKRCARAMSS